MGVVVVGCCDPSPAQTCTASCADAIVTVLDSSDDERPVIAVTSAQDDCNDDDLRRAIAASLSVAPPHREGIEGWAALLDGGRSASGRGRDMSGMERRRRGRRKGALSCRWQAAGVFTPHAQAAQVSCHGDTRPRTYAPARTHLAMQGRMGERAHTYP